MPIKEELVSTLSTAGFLLVGFLVGIIVSIIIFTMTDYAQEKEIICPPFMDKAQQEIKGINVWYELGQAPEYTDLDYEFVKACGFETIKSPVRIEPPPPEEGGA